ADIDRILRIPKAGNQPAELAVDSTSDIDPWSFSFSGMAVEGDKLYLTSYGRNALYRASLNGETS
ncbi:MAG TPA: hypothetical protein DF383_06860, partial [Deltaproteobacteria bacterium]|nr:hypothetical protein [Deltaproteobacteria bacterium]